MVKKSVIKQIDRVIKEVWIKNIQSDYMNEYMINEDCLKNCLYYHLRRRLATLLKENNLRIYTEFTFKNLGYRADMIIAQYDELWDGWFSNKITGENIVALIELKFSSGRDLRSQEWIKHDTAKFKDYLQCGNVDCQFYFGVIYEEECTYLNWLDKRSTNHWASGRVTELCGGFIDDVMTFGIHSYNNMNTDIQTEY